MINKDLLKTYIKTAKKCAENNFNITFEDELEYIINYVFENKDKWLNENDYTESRYEFINKDPRERLKVKQKELSNEIKLLRELLNSDKYNELSSIQQKLLEVQLENMKGYEQALKMRIEYWKEI